MQTLEKNTEQWKRIQRKEATYGEGEPKEQAARFYRDRLLPQIVDRERRRLADRKVRPVDCLISLLGFSPNTTILTFLILRPEELVVVTSGEAQNGIDVISEYVVNTDNLPANRFKHVRCDPTDPKSIYFEVEKQLKRSGGDRSRDAVLDITGGKKVMSAAAALAAWQLDLRLCYVETSYGDGMPLPGSEELLLLDNPITLFGEQALSAADAVFTAGAFDAAFRQYKALSERILDPSRARLMRDVSDLYARWCSLKFDNDSLKLAEEVEKHLERQSDLINDTHARQLRKQCEFLRHLHNKDKDALLLCCYLLGLHYQQLDRHEFAALLFYRTIESCLKQRLERQFADFDCGNADYSTIDRDEKDVLERYQRASDDIAPGFREDRLPKRVGCIQAAVLLYAYEDDLARKAGLLDVKRARYLHALTEIRNKSVLAHGTNSISEDDSKKLREQARQLLHAYWELHELDGRIDELCQQLSFIRVVAKDEPG